jgi:7,8-dihydropterin-6-yl-methyl-4-(beta-D-ribofuranosyl)aminobenzene 5'-phosphate synthase
MSLFSNYFNCVSPIYIESEGKWILFDTGDVAAFLLNAAKMKIDLPDIDYIVISHGRFNHTSRL